jgi:hypothetical protein
MYFRHEQIYVFILCDGVKKWRAHGDAFTVWFKVQTTNGVAR